MATSGIISIPLIFSAAALHHKAFTKPNRAPTTPRNYEAGFVEKTLFRHITVVAIVQKAVVWIIGGAEIAIILARDMPSWKYSRRILENLIPYGDCRKVGELGPQFLLGTGLVIAGAVLRWFCYRTLGKMFTYEISVQKDHKLITSGPYSIVRHPSYSGILLIIGGVFIWQSGPASWTRLGEILDHWEGKALVAVFAAWLGIGGIGVVQRAYTEDMLLRNEFGGQWTEWASRTNLLIPWVY
ncbi:hypothetical protein BDP27DRAFT_1368049 [Rhodocollybia butyracea]|uniref:Protein-S-isoprenylcysteine O-methyltransferase n=1 Tax=Rhodocollybia butyracea TaxID=206335 RepID=A0A9P5U193_9AGAR|nr:hypothetical protein BDP27DRAFT_1368049 [Rhodocollybia butyracea]